MPPRSIQIQVADVHHMIQAAPRAELHHNRQVGRGRRSSEEIDSVRVPQRAEFKIHKEKEQFERAIKNRNLSCLCPSRSLISEGCALDLIMLTSLLNSSLSSLVITGSKIRLTAIVIPIHSALYRTQNPPPTIGAREGFDAQTRCM